MGMSASQARLLFITSRMNDIELKSQQISNTKIRLADESEQVANAYTKALNKTRLQITDPLTQTTSQLTYNSIMSPNGIMSGGYNLQTVDGKVVVSHDVAAAFERRRGNSYQAEDISSYQTNYNNAVSTLDKAEATLNNYLESKDVTVNSDGTLKFPTKFVTLPPVLKNDTSGTDGVQDGGKVPTTDGAGSTGGAGGAGGTKGSGTVPTTDGAGSTGGAGGAGGVQGGGTVPTTDGVGSTGGAGGAKAAGAPRRIVQNPSSSRNSLPNAPTSINNNLTFSRTWSDAASPHEFVVKNPAARDFSTFTIDPTLPTGGGFQGGWTTGGTATGGTTGGTTTGRIPGEFKRIDLDLSKVEMPSSFGNVNVQLAKYNTDVYSNAEKSQIQAQYNIYKQDVSNAKQAVSEAKTALDDAKAKNASVSSNISEYSGEFYENLFKQMETSGYKAYDQKLLNNPEALQAYLGNGDWCLGKKNADGKYAQTSISSSTMISEVTDKTDLAKAEAEYNAQTLKINNKEKKLDNQLKTLDTEHSALKTEQESIKSLIKDNVDKSFNLFS